MILTAHTHIIRQLKVLRDDQKLLFKLTLPDVDDLYETLTTHPNVVRVVALSGGYTRKQANDLLARQHGVVASFSRALTEGLKDDLSQDAFDKLLDTSIQEIFDASKASPINKELHTHKLKDHTGLYHDVEEDFVNVSQ